jgi:hypothetical protein
MIGGQYDIFPFGKPLAVLQFAEATHDTNFLLAASRPEARDWIGGYIFYRERDFLDFFHSQAVKWGQFGCTDLNNCSWDPRQPRAVVSDQYHSDDYNEFVGGDHRRWIWVYVQDRNAWVAADRDRNIATYTIMRQYTTDVIHGEDDGNPGSSVAEGSSYPLQLPLKYFLDYFYQYN